MKTKLGLLLLILLIAVWCEDSTHGQQPVKSITNTIGMKLNKIPSGTFVMGSSEDETDHRDWENQHEVIITKAFYIQTTEVTQLQWKTVMGTEPWKGRYINNPHGIEGANYPAVYVSWDDAVAYCKKLSEKEGKTYRLPTEAEWEYACRAGTDTAWSFGDDEKEIGDYAWYRENAYLAGAQYPHQVGLKKPNAFGLYDMHGNVCEYCSDYFGIDYYKQSPEKDPPGPARDYRGLQKYVALRLGGWYHSARVTRSAARTWHPRKGSGDETGFRIVRELD